MTPTLPLAALSVALLAVAYASVRGIVCNVRQLRLARRSAPLAGLDLAAARVTPVPVPRHWPEVEDIDATGAAAYAALAEDRAITYALVGGLLEVAGAAAFGATFPLLFSGGYRGWWGMCAGAFIVLVGIVVRYLVTGRWEPVAARYRRRYAVLTAQPVQPAPPRPSFLDRLLGR